MKEKIKLPQEIIHLCKEVIPLRDIYKNNRNNLKPIGAVYSFWWIGDKKFLSNKARKKITLKGPGGRLVELEYKMWFPQELPYTSLYVGKATKLKSRISQHLLLKSPGRVHPKPRNHEKVKPKTTSCQLRAGIEHIFPDESKPRDFILDNMGLSFSAIDTVSRRFYLEDFVIGYFKPWFNLDCER